MIVEFSELIEDVCDSLKQYIKVQRQASDRKCYIKANRIKRNKVAVYDNELVGIADIYKNGMILIDDVFWLRVAAYGFECSNTLGKFRFQNPRIVDPRKLTRVKRVF